METKMSPDMWSDASDSEHLRAVDDSIIEDGFTDDDSFNNLFKTPNTAAKKRGSTPVNRSLSLSYTKPKISQIPESLLPIVDQHDLSWTSSLATPIAGNVSKSWTNFNTDEKKPFLPCQDETPGRRILFAYDDRKNFPATSSKTPNARIKNCDKPLQSTPKATAKESESPSTKPCDLQLSPISDLQELHANQTPLSSSARFGRNRRLSSECRSPVSKYLPITSKESPTEEQSSPSILAGQVILACSPPKSPIIGSRLAARSKKSNARLSLKSKDGKKVVKSKNIESQPNTITNKIDMSNGKEDLSPVIGSSFSSTKPSSDGFWVAKTSQVLLNFKKEASVSKSYQNEVSNDQNRNSLLSKEGNCSSIRSQYNLQDNDSTPLTDAFSADSRECDSFVDRNITSSPIISCNKIMKRKRKRGTNKLSNSKKIESISPPLKIPKNSHSSEASISSSRTATPNNECYAIPTPTSKQSLSSSTETMVATKLPVSPSNSSDVPFGFTSQDDLSISTLQEICKASDLIETIDRESNQPTTQTSSKKLKFVSAGKKDERRLTRNETNIENQINDNCMQHKCSESRVQSIKTRMDVAKSRNFLYPNLTDGKKKFSNNPVHMNQLMEYARLLEVVANLDSKAPNRSVGPCKGNNGFVQFSKMKQETITSKCDSPMLHENKLHSISKEKKSNCNPSDHPHKKEVQDTNDNAERDHVPISGTQITKLVKDAQKMFETEDSQWGYNLVDAKDHFKIGEEANASSNKCVGFDSASGKIINVSDCSLSKTQSVVSNDDLKLDIIETPPANAGKMLGFSSASGKKLNISKVAMNNARKLFEDFDSQIGKETLDSCTTPKPDSMPSLGFTSASGKKLSISETAINNARKLFHEVDLATREDVADSDTPKENSHTAGSVGLSSVSRKKLVSEGLMNKEKMPFGNSDTAVVENFDLNTSRSARSDQNSKIMAGFSSASGKKLNISDASINKARTLFEECDTFFGENKHIDTPKLTKNITMGFCSASGKKFNVSEASIKKAQTLFEDVESICGENKDTDTPKLSKNIPVGFTSASGKKFNVSKVAIKKARTLFEDFESTFGENKDNDMPKLSKNIPMGFSSASGKKFSVSEASIKKASSLFDNVDSPYDEKNENSETPKLNSKMPMGFSSASGKKCSVSDASIKKARTLFSDNDPWPPVKSDLELVHTADVQPSERLTNRPRNSAFKKPTSTDVGQSNTADKTVPTKSDEISSNCDTKPFGGFMAASGRKTATVSDSSLLQAKLLFYQSAPAKDTNQNNSTHQNLPAVKRDYGCSIITPNVLQDDIDIAEVMQATEAFMADEESGVPLWITTYTSSPSVSNDRMDHQPMVDGSVDKDSPILGQHDRFRPKERKPAPRLVVKPNPSENVLVFKTPYKKNDLGATQVATIVNDKKRGADFEFGTPFAKRVTSEVGRPAEALKQAELSTEEVSRLRDEAWERQKKAVKTKDRLSCRPCQGSQLLRKQAQQLTWKNLTQGHLPGHFSRAQLLKLGVRDAVVNVTADNAGDFVFSSQNHYGPSVCRGNTAGLPVGDAALLILDGTGRADVARVESAFLAGPGVDPALVPSGWVRNHHRWIVWKLAATERSFPRRFAARCLTPNVVLLQLKYRYDREIDRCERPAIRRILEQDDTSTRRLVLCVVRVVRLANAERRGFELELTDGWYSVMASLDSELNRMVAKGTVVVGTKLITHGAELSSREACHPLEAKADVRLKLSANSTRRARWHAKLGYQRNPGPLRLPLATVLPAGGLIGRLDVYVARVYPTLYVEMADNGTKVARSELAESREAALFERRRQTRVEAVYAKVRNELQADQQASGKPAVRCSARNLAGIASGSQLSRLLDQSPDPGSLQELLTSNQLAEVYKHRQQSGEAMMREVETRVQQALADEGEKRKVSTLLKIRCTALAGDGSNSAVLSVWRAPEDLPGLLREGAGVSVFNVTAAGSRMGSLQLSAGRQTRYQAQLATRTGPDPLLRCVTGFRAAARAGFCPPFGELDVVGVVVDVVTGSARGLQTVYLADAAFDFVGIAFWTGLKEAGLDELLKAGAAVAAWNLQWRGGPVRRLAHLHAVEQAAFSRNPRQPHLRAALEALVAESKLMGDFVEKARDKLVSILQDTKMPNHLPAAVSHPTTPRVAAYVPTACLPTPQMSPLDPDEPSPAQRRLDRLSCYSDPPPLPPLSITSSQSISKEFRLPARHAPDETNETDDYDSPPLSLESG